MVLYKWYQSQVGSIWTFDFTAVEPTLFRVVGMDSSWPPHFDSTNFPYYKARMACHLVRFINPGSLMGLLPSKNLSPADDVADDAQLQG